MTTKRKKAKRPAAVARRKGESPCKTCRTIIIHLTPSRDVRGRFRSKR